ncbi:MAG: ribonuclease P protein component [Sinobacteraceae bacterium]|nr:ribonuclease P protein component [Nevskiaceae bacterium]
MGEHNRLTPASRLRRPAQFKRTFSKGARSRSGPFLAVSSPCEDRAFAGGARLGLAIAKRNAPRAVERNRVKRQIREDFRHRAETLPNVDCVICLRAPTKAQSNAELRVSLDRLWLRILKTCNNSSSS